MSRVFGASYLIPVITEYGFHKITDGFNIACFFPTVRSVRSAEAIPDNVNLTELASTSSYSWSDTEFRFGQQSPPEFNESKDSKGPINVVVMADISIQSSETSKDRDQQTNTKPSEATTSREQTQLLVFGDSDFASNNYFNLQGNSDFFLNSINFLAQQENLISIERPKTAGTPFFLSPAQERLLFWVGLLLMPMVVLAAGIAVFRLRRKHR